MVKQNTNHRYELNLSPADVDLINKALKLWGKPDELVEKFGATFLRERLENWEEFVNSEWDEDWEFEYAHDIGVRYWIQLAIEHTTPETSNKIEALVTPLDQIFKNKAQPCPVREYAPAGPFKHKPYFWETHSIME
jgi:hypothetical protein